MCGASLEPLTGFEYLFVFFIYVKKRGEKKQQELLARSVVSLHFKNFKSRYNPRIHSYDNNNVLLQCGWDAQRRGQPPRNTPTPWRPSTWEEPWQKRRCSPRAEVRSRRGTRTCRLLREVCSTCSNKPKKQTTDEKFTFVCVFILPCSKFINFWFGSRKTIRIELLRRYSKKQTGIPSNIFYLKGPIKRGFTTDSTSSPAYSRFISRKTESLLERLREQAPKSRQKAIF